MKDRDILHVDLNNFYASVEMLLNPELKGCAVAVSGDPEARHGIILAKNQLAKSCGVKTGEAIWEAKQKCQGLICVPPHYKEYTKYSRKVREIYTEFTPYVESFGLDECWLDVTDCKRLYGTPEEIAYKIKDAIKERTNGLTVSVGVSFSKVFAKLGSDLKKPDAVSIVGRHNYKDVAWTLPIGEMLSVGRSTKVALSKLGIYTIGDMAQAPLKDVKKYFGKVGEKLWHYANGTDGERVNSYIDIHIPESVGNGTTTPKDVDNLKDATSVICSLAEMVGYRMRKHGLLATGVALSLRSNELKFFSRQTKLDASTNSAAEISKTAINLLKDNYDLSVSAPLRTITVTAIDLVAEDEIFDDNMSNKEDDVEKKVDVLRDKYGYGVLKRGVNIGTIFTCDNKEAEDDYIPFDRRSLADIDTKR